jgi:hypothetical protein
MSEENIKEEHPKEPNSSFDKITDDVSFEESVSEQSLLETENPKLQTATDMEVHKHPHHVMHKKKWAEYLLEFFMIFFAVSLGFYAENMREKIADNAKTREYAKSLYEDLKQDSITLHNFVTYHLWKQPKFDSLILLLGARDIQKNARLLYYYHLISWIAYSIKGSDATIQQLRSSGNLRYFNDIQLYNTITRYYTTFNSTNDRIELDESNSKIPATLIARLSNSSVLINMLTITPDIKNAVEIPKGNSQLLTTNPALINEYLYDIQSRRMASHLSLFLVRNTIKQLETLMGILQKKYGLH